MLYAKLQNAALALDKAVGQRSESPSSGRFFFERVVRKVGEVKRVKMVLLLKGVIDSTLEDLEHWHRLIQMPFYLITRISDPRVERQLQNQANNMVANSQLSTLKRLRKAIQPLPQTSHYNPPSVFISRSEFMEAQYPIPYSTGQLIQDSKTGKYLFLESFQLDQCITVQIGLKDARDLARRLAIVDPMCFGILTCRGIMEMAPTSTSPQQLQFVFDIPDSLHTPRSLRDILISSTKEGTCAYSLNERLEFARQLTRSVMFVHTANFVHKNINPETIIIFRNDHSSLATPFLTGFEKFRVADGHTSLVGDSEWEKDLYRYPLRQGIMAREAYKMQHDIYSLGVVLLELGLWYTFVMPGPFPKTYNPSPDTPNLWNESGMDQIERGYAIKAQFISIARAKLPQKMGQRYTEVVLSCLCCLDDGNTAFGDEREFTDADGVLIGLRYIEKVRILPVVATSGS